MFRRMRGALGGSRLYMLPGPTASQTKTPRSSQKLWRLRRFLHLVGTSRIRQNSHPKEAMLDKSGHAKRLVTKQYHESWLNDSPKRPAFPPPRTPGKRRRMTIRALSRVQSALYF
ncbi:uncharacterized protein CIMG_04561 [Coccidioides immitis RS]|uniref:Uncharacterized protein n=2 Tax=Coccidioides immitis TaxID=5501 RepID=J3KDS0_COCIM|nr:uncharacterized protein CIMG_04561 [Coccidioides immitis RS]EAS33537.3 hypothetical protein CIMG_04561 [Coccidioides immitis RS]KMP04708.1 hypothetical protein CIRG_04389 [Coccidioides immitis RMSCC 2394]